MSTLSHFIFAPQLAFLFPHSRRIIVFAVSLLILAAMFGGIVFLIIYLSRKNK